MPFIDTYLQNVSLGNREPGPPGRFSAPRPIAFEQGPGSVAIPLRTGCPRPGRRLASGGRGWVPVGPLSCIIRRLQVALGVDGRSSHICDENFRRAVEKGSCTITAGLDQPFRPFRRLVSFTIHTCSTRKLLAGSKSGWSYGSFLKSSANVTRVLGHCVLALVLRSGPLFQHVLGPDLGGSHSSKTCDDLADLRQVVQALRRVGLQKAQAKVRKQRVRPPQALCNIDLANLALREVWKTAFQRLGLTLTNHSFP